MLQYCAASRRNIAGLTGLKVPPDLQKMNRLLGSLSEAAAPASYEHQSLTVAGGVVASTTARCKAQQKQGENATM